jgi:hypothetical protein
MRRYGAVSVVGNSDSIENSINVRPNYVAQGIKDVAQRTENGKQGVWGLCVGYLVKGGQGGTIDSPWRWHGEPGTAEVVEVVEPESAVVDEGGLAGAW